MLTEGGNVMSAFRMLGCVALWSSVVSWGLGALGCDGMRRLLTLLPGRAGLWPP